MIKCKTCGLATLDYLIDCDGNCLTCWDATKTVVILSDIVNRIQMSNKNSIEIMANCGRILSALNDLRDKLEQNNY